LGTQGAYHQISVRGKKRKEKKKLIGSIKKIFQKGGIPRKKTGVRLLN